MMRRDMRGLIPVILFCGLLLACHAAWGEAAAARALGDTTYVKDWNSTKSEITDTSIDQEWRLTFTRLPVNVDAYDLLTYQAAQLATPQLAASASQQMLSKRRFTEYIVKGYSVDATPWGVDPSRGVEFTVTGTDVTLDGMRAHYAHLYTLAFSVDTWAVFLEVREAANADTLAAAQRALRGHDITTMAADYELMVSGLWLTSLTAVATAPPAGETGTTTPPPPATGDGGMGTSPAPAGSGTTAPPTPPAAGSTGVLPSPPSASAGSTGGGTSPAPPSPAPPTSPPPPTDGTRWSTPDGHLSMMLPKGATIGGTSVYTITGVANAKIMLYDMGSYTDDKDLTAALEDFAASQLAISKANYTRGRFDVAGARGLRVAYVTTDYVAQKDIERISYCFGASQRLWRLDVELPTTKDEQPDAVTTLISSITLQ